MFKLTLSEKEQQVLKVALSDRSRRSVEDTLSNRSLSETFSKC